MKKSNAKVLNIREMAHTCGGFNRHTKILRSRKTRQEQLSAVADNDSIQVKIDGTITFDKEKQNFLYILA